VRSNVLPDIAELSGVVSFSSAHMPVRSSKTPENEEVVAPMVMSITSSCGYCQWTSVAVDVMESRSELQCQLGLPAVCGEKWTSDSGMQVDRLSCDYASLVAALRHHT
jgi:hypothetical protein